MSETPRISVIIPAYKVEAFLAEAIDSVLAQTLPPLEVIVVDDGSPDGSAAIAEQYGERVRLIRKHNGGVSSARNAGLKAARGDWIAFLDGDDVWRPEKLQLQVQALKTYPEALIVFTEFKSWASDSAGHYPAMNRITASSSSAECVPELSGWIYHQFLLTNWVLTSSVLANRKVFEAVGYFREDLPVAEDWDIWLRASHQFQFCKVKASLVLYRQQAGSLTQRVREEDYASQIIEDAVARWGDASPSGTRVDQTAYRQRRFRAHFNHGLGHFAKGSARVARQAFQAALRYRPMYWKLWVYWLVASLRSVSE